MSEQEAAGGSAGAETEAEEKKTRLTDEQWKEICDLYELGQASTPELSKKFGVSVQALSQYFKRHSIVKGSKAEALKKAATAAAAAATATVVAKKVADFEEERLERISHAKRSFDDAQRVLSQAITAAYVGAVKDGRPVSTEAANVKTLRMMISALSVSRQERFAILEADKLIDEAKLPTLVIEDLSQNQIEELQKQAADLDLDVELPELDVGDDEVVVEE